jgi:4-amino-4-deoxychorismate synthase (2-amino-4-deoxychorismate-forming) component I
MDTDLVTNFIRRPLPATVDLLTQHAAHPENYPCLLQSTAQGRYDLLFALPGDALVLHADGSLTGPYIEKAGGDFLRALDLWWRALRLPESPAGAPLFRGGWFLFIGYELAQQIEPTLNLQKVSGLPIAFAMRVPAAIIFDHVSHTHECVIEAEYATRLPEIMKTAPACITSNMPTNLLSTQLEEEEPQRYLDSVASARRYIHDGDIFQANISRRWRAELFPQVSSAAIYRRLCVANPAPFAGLARLGTHAIISSSPERLVSTHGRRVDVRPIAGTRPRSTNGIHDTHVINELITHPKERAEHVMLLDLERNDLGRICTTGSIHVNELMVVESYQHVHHIVSNVCGQLRSEITPGEVIRAVFPGGTITGCPKVRCMQIIAELEAAPRGAYTGALGYLNRDGDLDLNILIRTLVQHGRQIEFRAGAGIVADSLPVRELDETRAKAIGMVRALLGEP